MAITGDAVFNNLKNTNNAANVFAPGAGIPEVPSNEELSTLAMLLKITDKAPEFRDLVSKDLAFIRASANLLNSDEVLRAQMGGGGFRNVLQLSGMLKQQFNQTLMQARTARAIPAILTDLGMTGTQFKQLLFGSGEGYQTNKDGDNNNIITGDNLWNNKNPLGIAKNWFIRNYPDGSGVDNRGIPTSTAIRKSHSVFYTRNHSQQ